jgi:hypothetical protein
MSMRPTKLSTLTSLAPSSPHCGGSRHSLRSISVKTISSQPIQRNSACLERSVPGHHKRSAPKTAKTADSMAALEEDLAPLDSGTRARLLVVMQVAQEQKLENDRLKQLIREQIPAPRRDSNATAASPPCAATSTLKTWINGFQSGTGPLEMDTSGVRLTRHARPRQVVIPADVLVSLVALCGMEAASQMPDLPISAS